MSAPVEGASLLEARAVTVDVGGRRLLDGVDLAVRAGEVLALVGPNGAGKSTLLKVLAGDLAPSSGAVLLAGRPIGSYGVGELARRRAVLPQQTVLEFAFTVGEVVAMGRSPHRVRGNGRDDDGAVAAAMARTETTALVERVYPSLSGGEQARVDLARVLTQETTLLLLDEPTASLDLRHQGRVMAVARELAAAGAAVLAVLHDLNLAAAHADRLAILCRGRLAAAGAPWAVLEDRVLSDVFGCPIAVTRHPVHGCPLVLPLAGNGDHGGPEAGAP